MVVPEEEICRLYQQPAILENSHLIPGFVFKWIKETSMTGFLRTLPSPNRREQDGLKLKLLGPKAEDLFSEFETKFANYVFHPWVKSFNDQGSSEGGFEHIEYDSWLLKFAISVNWRILTHERLKGFSAKLTAKQQEILNTAEDSWRRFLIGESHSTGQGETYIIFLQSFAGVKGDPLSFPKKINFYLIRATDGCAVFGKKNVGVFSKLGPIAIYTSLTPERLPNMTDARIHMRGKLPMKVSLGPNQFIEFLYKIRPEEFGNLLQISDNQKLKISDSIRKDVEKAATSLAFSASVLDWQMEDWRNEFNENETEDN